MSLLVVVGAGEFHIHLMHCLLRKIIVAQSNMFCSWWSDLNFDNTIANRNKHTDETILRELGSLKGGKDSDD